jgi:hypothetical protein
MVGRTKVSYLVNPLYLVHISPPNSISHYLKVVLHPIKAIAFVLCAEIHMFSTRKGTCNLIELIEDEELVTITIFCHGCLHVEEFHATCY